MIESIPLPQLINPITIAYSEEIGEPSSPQIFATPASSSTQV